MQPRLIDRHNEKDTSCPYRCNKHGYLLPCEGITCMAWCSWNLSETKGYCRLIYKPQEK